MFSAIIFKEWLKTRRVFFVALTAALLVALYVIVSTKAVITEHGIISLWMSMILKDVSLADTVTYIPLAIGVAVGIAQMAPEVSHKRLKLTLHLPYPQFRLVAMMLATGLIELLIIYSVQIAAILIYDSTLLHPELVGRVALTMLPWYLAGFVGYLFVTAICLEGTWFMRILLGLTGAAVLPVMFLNPTYMTTYKPMLLTIVAFILIITTLSFGSISRFKEGHQD